MIQLYVRLGRRFEGEGREPFAGVDTPSERRSWTAQQEGVRAGVRIGDPPPKALQFKALAICSIASHPTIHPSHDVPQDPEKRAKCFVSRVFRAKPRENPYKSFDGGGLHLLINPSGSRLWRLTYRVDGREKSLSFGTYPEVSLKDPRDRRDDARRLLRQGIDPGAQKKAEKAAAAETFEAIAREWFEKFAPR